MTTRASRLQSITGIDFHVGIALLNQGWTIVAGGVMILVIPATLSPLQQGYYFAFASLLALQVVFDLGLNQVITQLVGHEMAHLGWDESGRLRGEPAHADRVRSVVTKVRTWYRIAAALFFVIAGAAGAFLFAHSGPLPAAQWGGPWAILVAATALNLRLSPLLSVVEGCGQVGQVARLRLVQSMAGYLLAWAALALGAGLWAVALVPAVACVLTASWLRLGQSVVRALDAPVPIPAERGVDWRREVFPFQWRIAISWISGYVMFQLFTPVAFVHLGPVEAGRLGMSIAIFAALQSVGVSWVNAKMPVMTGHISRGEVAGLEALFRGMTLRACLLTGSGSIAIVLLVVALGHFGVPIRDRLADSGTLAAIALTTSVNTLVYSAATYMRAHRMERMMPVSIFAAVATLLAVFAVSRHGTLPTMLAQALITTCCVLPWTLLLLRTHRRGARA